MIFIKRINNIVTENNVTHELCVKAIYEASNRKREKSFVKKILKNIDKYADIVRNMILMDTFMPSPYQYAVRIERGKERKLQKPKFFPDQVVHHVLIMLVRDRFLARIDPYAVAGIPGRGQKLGIDKLAFWIQREGRRRTKTKYCVKGDIRHCFESIKPDIIMQLFKRLIKDRLYLSLVSKIIYSTDSLPLGNYMSIWILNLLLKDFDDAIRKQPYVTHYFRYADDFVAFSSNKKKLKLLKCVVVAYLSKIGVKLKDNYQLFKLEDRGLDMLGYRFYRNTTILRKRNLKSIYRDTHKMKKLTIYDVYSCLSLVSRLGMCRHCNSKYVYRTVGKSVNMYKVKDIIRDSSRYLLGFTPKNILIFGR